MQHNTLTHTHTHTLTHTHTHSLTHSLAHEALIHLRACMLSYADVISTRSITIVPYESHTLAGPLEVYKRAMQIFSLSICFFSRSAGASACTPCHAGSFYGSTGACALAHVVCVCARARTRACVF